MNGRWPDMFVEPSDRVKLFTLNFLGIEYSYCLVEAVHRDLDGGLEVRVAADNYCAVEGSTPGINEQLRREVYIRAFLFSLDDLDEGTLSRAWICQGHRNDV